MEKRPISLTIIAWVLIISAVFTVVSVFMMASNPVAAAAIERMHTTLLVQQVLGVLGVLVAAACAYGIFKGLPWSRVLYVAWGLLGVVYALVASPIKSSALVSLIFIAVIAYFLFSKRANLWFAARGLMLQRERA